MPESDERMNAFAPVTNAEWLDKVEADLKGASLDRLRTRTPGGLELEPLYTAEDPIDVAGDGWPGVYPFVRGSAPLGGWTIQQEYDDPRADVCRALIERDLERGVQAVWLRAGPRIGCRVMTVDALDELLASVNLAAVPVTLDGGCDTMAMAAGLFAVARRRGVEPDALRGGFAFDPIGLLAAEGRLMGGLGARLDQARDLAAWCAGHAPGLRSLDVSSDPYVGGGASIVQELAFTIATGIEYLRRLVDGGMSVDVAAQRIGFSYAISSHFFMQIAKLRAARAMWAKVIVASGGESSTAAMHLHVRTSRFTKTSRDPWVNMLRSTAECTAAVLGGALSIATLPYDSEIGPADALARRVARNTQMVLRDESHLGEVADPAGGSWFVERLTDQLTEAAWAEVRALEGAGGILKALGSGRVVDAVGDVRKQRRESIAKRKTPIVGVSEFPNLSEETVEREPLSESEIKQLVRSALDRLDVGGHRKELIALARQVNDPRREPGALTEGCVVATSQGTDLYSVAAVMQHGQPDFHVEPIVQWRESDAWETLRARAEEAGSRPVAFLANLGPIPAHKARSTWAQNLLAAAGIASTANDGFDDVSALASGWSSSGAALAVICGSDADYEKMLAPAVEALKAAGCPIVLVAGRPGNDAARLRDAGVSDFVFVGADVLRVMDEVLDSVGVER